MYSPRTPKGYNSRSLRSGKTPLNSSSRPLSRNRSFVNNRLSFTSPVDPWSSFSTSRRQSWNVSGNQSSVLFADNKNYIIQGYGCILPVLVTEALSLSDRSLEVSAKLSDSGWAWLVSGRRLFIWKYTAVICGRNTVSFCRELTLPPSDLAHKADLVCILTTKDILTPSAIAVSPEGIVRYWASIAHESASSEIAVDLQGQECFSLINIQPLGCIVATTTSSLVQLVPTVIDGQYTIISQTLKVPHGVLAGIGRRVSSFIFGGVPNQTAESKQLSRVLAEDGDDEDSKYVYVVSGNSLQKWLLVADEPERLVSEVDLEGQIQEHFLRTFHCQEHRIKSCLVDMQLSHEGLLLLIACSIPQSNQVTSINYAFALLDRESPGNILSFSPMKYTEEINNYSDDKLSGFHLILPSLHSHIAYMYDEQKIICVVLTNASTEEAEVLEVAKYDDHILGAGVCEDLPLFFSSLHGILSVNAIVPETSFHGNNSQILEAASSLAEIEQISMSDDKKSQVRAAFLLYCRNEINKSQSLIEEVFLSVPGLSSQLDSELDLSVILLSRELIDEFPASDPRWMESVPDNTVFTSSVIILRQLTDKLRVQETFVSFLKVTGLLKKLYLVSGRQDEPNSATRIILCQHAEKLKAAIALQGLHAHYGEFLNKAIERVVISRGSNIPPRLTVQDVFYREVSIIEDIFLAIFDQQQELLEGAGPKESFDIVTTVNKIFLEVLQAIVQYRQSSVLLDNGDPLEVEYISWIATEGTSGIRTVFLKQYSVTFDQSKVVLEDGQPNSVVYQQLVDLADCILDGYRCQLDSLNNDDIRFEEVNQKYTQHRSYLISVLLDADQHERAASLAEKYCDFGILVKLCEKTNNQDRLQRYMIQFVDQGFPNFLFKWYLDEGKRGRLLSQPATQHQEVARFLESHENLSWLHHLNTGCFSIAQKQLHMLAEEEKQFMNKKKTLLSLSKLTSLASEEPRNVIEQEVQNINIQQDILLYQETLPLPVLEANGLDSDNMRVLSPRELIELYISAENIDANEYDFKKALDLLEFCEELPIDLEPLRMQVWCRAILRDHWDELNVNTPVESVRETLFFRIAELAFTQGVNMNDYLPSMDDILQAEEELCSLVKEPHFVFMLKVVFEHIEHLLD